MEIETKNRPNTTNAKGARTVRMGIGTAAERICMGLARLGSVTKETKTILQHTRIHTRCVGVGLWQASSELDPGRGKRFEITEHGLH